MKGSVRGLFLKEQSRNADVNQGLSKAILEMLHITKVSAIHRAIPHPYMKRIYQHLESLEAQDFGRSDGILVQSFRSVDGPHHAPQGWIWFNISSLNPSMLGAELVLYRKTLHSRPLSVTVTLHSIIISQDNLNEIPALEERQLTLDQRPSSGYDVFDVSAVLAVKPLEVVGFQLSTKPVKQAVFLLIATGRRCSNMSGNHFKGHEVSCCIKYFIFGFNILFWLLGMALVGIGLWAWSEKGVLSNISSITDLGGLDPVWLFMVVGGVMFILGFAGCIGALRENTFLLKFFSVFLGIIFFLELTTGVLAFVFKDWIKDQLNLFINNNIRAYRDDIDLQNLIDFTQEYWECCGAFGADDWNLNIYFNCTDGNPSREKCGVPFSCCTKDPAEDVINTQCGYDIRAKPDSEQKDNINVKGCVPQFEKWLQDNLTLVAGIFIGVALLQIFGICLAQNLVSDIEAVRASCFFT
ncbi:hypothetical protein CRENBAI_006857 [Crenichthys baileyi]|uniref:Tetraspanin n=2 Tax=Goodeidae TaxID=28758 RepID=A0AAV9RNA9_9TELE